jgi:tRNA modification GTPase
VSSQDTIAAVASAPGRGAVGVIRVSGPEVPRIAAAILGALPAPRHARLSSFLDAQGQSLDEGLALYFPAPASYTGEHVLEIHGHGGALIVDMVLKRLLELGCRMARPGEFSERAFLNGKIDIAQAEAIADLIDAGSTAAARAAVRSLQGEFSARIGDLNSHITALRAYVEAAIDFPDEEIDFLSGELLQERLAVVFSGFDTITSAARQGALLREGLNVAIAGPANAGKSSLLNRLAGDEVAIVTDVPGTTRDVLRQQVHLDGLPLNLVDTAGLRSTLDVVEAEGVRRARAEIARADRVIYILDASIAGANASSADVPNGKDEQYWAAEIAQLPHGIPVTLVFNKIDLMGIPPRLDATAVPPRLFLSARTGEGIDLLRSHLKAAAGYQQSESGALAARRRHLDALSRARRHVQSAADILQSTRAFELFAEDLRLAQHALGEITGEFTSDDLLGEIFGSFCIGK